MHQLEGLKHVQKTKEANVERLDAGVLGFREALASKEKELADLKGSHLAEVESFNKQIATLQSSTEALKNAKEEACKTVEDKSAEVE